MAYQRRSTSPRPAMTAARPHPKHVARDATAAPWSEGFPVSDAAPEGEAFDLAESVGCTASTIATLVMVFTDPSGSVVVLRT